MANKIKYGLCNVHYSLLTFDETTGAPTWGVPVAWPGAVELTMDAQGDSTDFYADNITYWKGTANNGYSGTFTSALIPDSVRTDILGDKVSTNGMIVENAEAPTVPFALLFQFEGDQEATRHILYNCTMSRPALGGKTKESQIEPQTEQVNLSATALRVGDNVFTKSRCPKDSAAYATFFTTAPTAPEFD